MTASRNPLLPALIVLQFATLCVTLLVLFATKQPIARATPAPAIHPQPAAASSLSAELKAELRAIVRAEMSAAMTGTVAVAGAESAPALSGQQRELQTQAAAVSAAIIDQAVSAGVWTRADTEALLPQLGSISPEQRLALVEEFYAAINRQELTLKDFPPL
jgi:hypothetical protein